MEESRLAVRVEHIPAHKYLGIWEKKLGYQILRPVKRVK